MHVATSASRLFWEKRRGRAANTPPAVNYR